MTPLLVALLEQLYDVKREHLSQGVRIESFYMLVISTLMIVQDATLRPVLCRMFVDLDLAWYREKRLKNVSISSPRINIVNDVD